MSKDIIDRYLGQKVDTSRLSALEHDVWQGILARKPQEKPGWLEQWLAPLLVPQYRFATLGLAIALGLTMGEMTKAQLITGAAPAAQMLNMQVFSPQSGLLLAELTKEPS